MTRADGFWASIGWLAAAALLQACQKAPAAPEPIRPAEDTCAFCRMQIAQTKFAAEILNADGDAVKFDDIGCFRAYRAAHPETRSAEAWVIDSETGAWLRAADAKYLLDAPDRTPMGFGIVAYASEVRARSHGSRVVGFDEMLAAGK